LNNKLRICAKLGLLAKVNKHFIRDIPDIQIYLQQRYNFKIPDYSTTKLELSEIAKIKDIIISSFQEWGVAFCYLF